VNDLIDIPEFEMPRHAFPYQVVPYVPFTFEARIGKPAQNIGSYGVSFFASNIVFLRFFQVV
jgi:hypothetical protein